MPRTIFNDPIVSLITGFFLGIIGSLIAASIHPPLIGYLIKLFSKKITNLKFIYVNHGVPNISFGVDENHFEANWSPASSDTIHLYNQRPDTKVIGTIRNVNEFYLITNIVKYLHVIEGGTDISKGQFFILQNPYDKYAIVQLFDYRPGAIGGEGDIHVKYKIVKPTSK